MKVELQKIFDLFPKDQKWMFPKAYEIAVESFQGVTRKDGVTPYIEHIEDVMIGTFNQMKDRFNHEYLDGALSVAALHDTYEDFPKKYSLQLLGILLEPFSRSKDCLRNVINGIDAISKRGRDVEMYDEYVMRVASHLWAMFVKLADIEDNSEDLKQGSRLDKYQLTTHVLLHVLLQELKHI